MPFNLALHLFIVATLCRGDERHATCACSELLRVPTLPAANPAQHKRHISDEI
jgi:hypothetical protein